MMAATHTPSTFRKPKLPRLPSILRRGTSKESLQSQRSSLMRRILRSRLVTPFRIVYGCLATLSDGTATPTFPPRSRSASLEIAPAATPPPADFFSTTRSIETTAYLESSALIAPAPSRSNTLDVSLLSPAHVEEDWVARVYGWRHEPIATQAAVSKRQKWSLGTWLRRRSDTNVHLAAQPIITGQTIVMSAPASPVETEQQPRDSTKESSSAGLSRLTRRSAPSVEDEAKLNQSFQSRKAADVLLSFSVVEFDEPVQQAESMDQLNISSIHNPPARPREPVPEDDEDDWGMGVIAQRYSDRKGKTAAGGHLVAGWDLVKQSPILLYDALDESPTKSNEATDARQVVDASRIYGASKEKIVEWMTLHIDTQFVLDFFLTYRSIMTPEELCTLLVSRFWWALREEEECLFAQDSVDQAEVAEKRLVRIRLYALFKTWLLDHFQQDFLPRARLRRKFTSFLNQVMKNVVISASERDLRIVKRLRSLYRHLWQYYHPRSPAPSTSAAKRLPALPTDKPLPAFPWEESDIEHAGNSSDGASVYSIEQRALPDGASPLVRQQLQIVHKSRSLPNIKSTAVQPVSPVASGRRNSMHVEQSAFTRLKTAVLRDISLVKRSLHSRRHKPFSDDSSQEQYSSESEVQFTSAGEDDHPLCTCGQQRARTPLPGQGAFEVPVRASTPAITIVVDAVVTDDEREASIWQRIGTGLSSIRPTSPSGRPDTGYGSDGRRIKRCSFCVERLKAERRAAKEREKRSFVADFRSEEIARALWMVERKHLLSIRVGELMDKRCLATTSTNITGTNAIRQLVNRFNAGYQWVASEVVSTPAIKERVYVIEKFIRVALKCYMHGNYASCCQIVLGLNSLACRRLDKTWRRVGAYEMHWLNRFASIITPKNNWASMRAAMEGRVESVLGVPLEQERQAEALADGCIPFLGPYLADLTFNEELPTFVFNQDAAMVHVHKLRIQGKVIRQILTFQYLAQRISFEHVDQRLLRLCSDVRCLDNQTLMQLSAAVE